MEHVEHPDEAEAPRLEGEVRRIHDAVETGVQEDVGLVDRRNPLLHEAHSRAEL
jgi:hypothetical protein